MAGIYIHIPFCKSRCNYCDFHSTTYLAKKDLILAAIADEMEQRRGFMSDAKIETIYIGGGTPSLCTPEQIGGLIDKASKLWDSSTLREVTMEANPDDITAEYLDRIASCGVNRLSIGVQSFIDRDLKWMNRRHDSTSARAAVRTAREAGFKNITIDLIYGIPGMTICEWQHNLQEAIKLNAEHISAYHLTIEPKTKFGKLADKGTLKEIDQELSSIESDLMQRLLGDAGYEQYEISNFAKPGFESIHNSNYWNGSHYLGVGPSAHSYNGIERQWNVANNTAYLEQQKTNSHFERESLNEDNRYNELIMTSLRTSKGIDSQKIDDLFGARKLQYFLNQAQKHIRLGSILQEGNRYYIPKHKFMISDGVISDLFI